MNRIGEGNVQSIDNREAAASPSAAAKGKPAHRRSCRVAISMPVTVYGKGADGRIFHEETTTLVVNAHGALLLLRTPVAKGQGLVIVNPKIGREVEGHVVYAKSSNGHEAEVGVEFDAPAGRFWGIAFPPPDWDNADRKLPSTVKRAGP